MTDQKETNWKFIFFCFSPCRVAEHNMDNTSIHLALNESIH